MANFGQTAHLDGLWYRLVRVGTSLLLRLGFSFRVYGAEHVPLAGGVILAGNHTGWLDSLMVSNSLRRHVGFLVDVSITRWPVLGPLIQSFGVIAVSPRKERSAMGLVAKALAETQDAVCIFPEGKLTTTGELLPFQRGVLFIQALASKQAGQMVPIVPFAIRGGFEAWPWGQTWPTFRPVSLTFGAPLIFSDDADDAARLEQLRMAVAQLKDGF